MSSLISSSVVVSFGASVAEPAPPGVFVVSCVIVSDVSVVATVSVVAASVVAFVVVITTIFLVVVVCFTVVVVVSGISYLVPSKALSATYSTFSIPDTVARFVQPRNAHSPIDCILPSIVICVIPVHPEKACFPISSIVSGNTTLVIPVTSSYTPAPIFLIPSGIIKLPVFFVVPKRIPFTTKFPSEALTDVFNHSVYVNALYPMSVTLLGILIFLIDFVP